MCPFKQRLSARQSSQVDVANFEEGICAVPAVPVRVRVR